MSCFAILVSCVIGSGRTRNRVTEAAYLKEPFTTVVWAVLRESNRDGETHVISPESHSHPYARGTLGGGPESHKISSFGGRDTMALGRAQPLQKCVILKGGNQRNQSPARFSSHPPKSAAMPPIGWTQLENRAREPGWHSPHCLATQGAEHAEYVDRVGQTEDPAERVRDLWLWEILAHFMSHLIKLHPGLWFAFSFWSMPCHKGIFTFLNNKSDLSCWLQLFSLLHGNSSQWKEIYFIFFFLLLGLRQLSFLQLPLWIS